MVSPVAAGAAVGAAVDCAKDAAGQQDAPAARRSASGKRADRGVNCIMRLYRPDEADRQMNGMRAELVAVARSMGMRKCAVIYSNSITKMQLGRLSEQSYRFFASEKEALAWVKE